MSSSGKNEGVVKQQLINNRADLDFKRLRMKLCELHINTTCSQCRAADGEVFLTLHRVLQTARGGRQPGKGK